MNVFWGAMTGTLATSTPLLLAALGENVVQRAGVVNVGLEGMMLVGAFTAVLGAKDSGLLHVGNPYLGVAVAAVAGVLFALLFAAFALKLAANQVVIGIVLNLFALGLTGTLYRTFFGTSGSFLSEQTHALPRNLLGQTPLTALALIATPALWLALNRTRRGLELRACGEQPVAAEAAGVNVLGRRTAALAFGGAMAGMAGAYLSIGQNNTFVENMTAGRGFIALAVVTSGGWNPWGCLVAALVFGYAEALQFQLQAQSYHLPYQLFVALPYVVTLILLAGGGQWSKAPAFLGRPYRRA